MCGHVCRGILVLNRHYNTYLTVLNYNQSKFSFILYFLYLLIKYPYQVFLSQNHPFYAFHLSQFTVVNSILKF